MRIGTTEIILLLVLALVIFGGNKLSGVGKALGTSIRDFKSEMNADKPEEAPKAEAPAEPVKAETEKEEGGTDA